MDKRTILALLLMAALLMIYPAIFMREPTPEQKPAQKSETPVAPAPAPVAPSAAAAVSPTTPPPSPKDAPAVPERTAVIETPLYRAVDREPRAGRSRPGISTSAARSLWCYRAPWTLRGWVVERPGQPPRPIAFALSTESIKLDKDTPTGELRMVGEDGFGIRVSQVLRFRADGYVVEHELKVENRHTVAQAVELAQMWSAPAEWPKAQEQFAGARPIHVVRLPQGSLWSRREYLNKAMDYVGEDRWVGFESGITPVGQNGVYLTALIPKSKGIGVVEVRRELKKENESAVLHAAEIGVQVAVPALEPGKAWEGQLQSYMGPKEYERLKALGVGPREIDLLRRLPLPRVVGGALRPSHVPDGMDRRSHPLAPAVVLPLRSELRRRHHPADRDHQGAASSRSPSRA